jgi:hypothetical protein
MKPPPAAEACPAVPATAANTPPTTTTSPTIVSFQRAGKAERNLFFIFSLSL